MNNFRKNTFANITIEFMQYKLVQFSFLFHKYTTIRYQKDGIPMILQKDNFLF